MERQKKDQAYHLIQYTSKYYYMQIGVMLYTLQKKILRISYRSFRHDKNDVINAWLYVLAEDEPRYWKKWLECKGCQLAAKAPSIKIQQWPKTDFP